MFFGRRHDDPEAHEDPEAVAEFLGGGRPGGVVFPLVGGGGGADAAASVPAGAVDTVVVDLTVTASSADARLSDPDKWVSRQLESGGKAAGATDRRLSDPSVCAAQYSQVRDARQAAGLPVATQRDFEIKASSNFCNPKDPDFLLKAYPEKFPFGHGAFVDPARRRDFSSFAAYAEHLSRLSTGSFQDAEIQLFFNDRINAQRMASAAYVACTMSPASAGVGAGAAPGTTPAGPLFARLQPPDLRVAGAYMQACAAARKAGRRAPDPPVSATLSAGFFKSLDRCVATSQTSAEGAMRARRDATAMHQAFGTATWFVTIAPNDRNSPSLVCLCLDDLRLHRESISDPSTMERPDRSFMLQLPAHCPAACALNFERFLDVFIKHALGWDAEAGCAVEGGVCVWCHRRVFRVRGRAKAKAFACPLCGVG